MDILQNHEVFEIEVLEFLKNGGFLSPLVFGGGTMLRLCYELNRYSSDLDFWFIKKVSHKAYFGKLKKYLGGIYELTDAQIKFYTLLFELRSGAYPKKLKIEIRKEAKKCDFQEKIAFSRYGVKQVVLRTHTLQQTMNNKINAALDRKDIRDFFDMEFLLRQGTSFETVSKTKILKIKNMADNFKARDFKVALGAVLDGPTRKYYAENGFEYLAGKINMALNA